MAEKLDEPLALCGDPISDRLERNSREDQKSIRGLSRVMEREGDAYHLVRHVHRRGQGAILKKAEKPRDPHHEHRTTHVHHHAAVVHCGGTTVYWWTHTSIYWCIHIVMLMARNRTHRNRPPFAVVTP